MLLMVVASCVFSCYGIRYRRLQPQRAAVAKLEALGPLIRQFGDEVDDVDFSNCTNKPTDDDLASLEPLGGLQFLDLSGSPITDAGLAHLKGLKNLSWVQLTNTRVTSRGVEDLKRALPKANVYWTPAGIPPPRPRPTAPPPKAANKK